eukprot:COSAG01_NODE_2428_length_7717_cov_5.280126_2_plen_120_part_00
MALKIDTGLWGGLPLSSSRSLNLTMRLVFLDHGAGQFSVHYDGRTAADDASPAVVVKKKGSGEWRELCFELVSPRFGGAGPSGADVWVKNDDKHDDVFDSLEISAESADEIAMNGCDWK